MVSIFAGKIALTALLTTLFADVSVMILCYRTIKVTFYSLSVSKKMK